MNACFQNIKTVSTENVLVFVYKCYFFTVFRLDTIGSLVLVSKIKE